MSILKIKVVALISSVILLSACNEEYADSKQALRRDLFRECMQLLPAGPVQTKYNDWSEVVDSCGSQAQYLSHRPPKGYK